ncbi:hypothetical protein PWT90_03128 [Aphanocladium album]|nr:hypothetical protein PWT90_03128 [Aphanocladium album]
MATSTVPRYSSEDFETASIRSAAPSYGETHNKLTQREVSEAPSYHSTVPSSDAAPTYTPRRTVLPTAATTAAEVETAIEPRRQEPAHAQTIGLPPVPARPPNRMPPSFSFPMWATTDTPTTRHYRKIVERREVDGRYQTTGSPERQRATRLLEEQNATNAAEFRPLEDPYLVGEQAAAEARRDRLAREGSDATLQQEERQWDWLIAQMRGWEERERSWTRIRGEANALQRRRLSRRGGPRILSMH